MASYYVQVHPNKRTWSLLQQAYEKKKSKQIRIPKSVWPSLGFDASWPIERARERVAELNQMNTIERERNRAKTAAAQRVHKEEKIISIFLPPQHVREFDGLLCRNNMGGAKHLNKRLLMWESAKKIIAAVSMDPRNWCENPKIFYKEFQRKTYSPDYVNKLLGLINKWGQFISRKNGLPFDPIEKPISKELTAIKKSYRTSDRCREGGSDPLTPAMLEAMKLKISSDHYEWLYISIWFGLRPDEIELAQFKTYHDETYNVKVLEIWQPKVSMFKYIPVIYPEQEKALAWLRPLKRPLNKTLKLHSGNEKLTVYSGRKGFEDLMKKLGETFVDISRWLGHVSLRTTEKHYRKTNTVVLSRKIVK